MYIDEEIFEFEDVYDIIEQGRELEVIHGCEFDIDINPDGTLSLVDMQGANLAGIEEEVFKDYEDILNRLEGSYLYNYRYVW